MNKLPIKFYGSIKDWRFPWILGLTFFFLEMHYHLKLYHLYAYFFAVGIISLIYEWLGWGQLTQTELKVRFGILRLLKLCLDRDTIEKIGIITKVYHHVGLARFGAMYDKKGYEKEYIFIKLRSAVTDKTIRLLKSHRFQMLFGQGITLEDSNKAIVLHRWPACGINAFFNSIAPYIPIEYDKLESSTDNTKNQKLNLIDFVLFVFPVAIIKVFG